MSDLAEMLAYVGFGEADRERLRTLEPLLAPSFPAIADRFYEAVMASPKAAAVLVDPARVTRLRGSLIDWMSSGLRGPYDDRFYDKRSRIGRRHVVIGLPQHYMFTAMTVIRDAYAERVATLYPPDQAFAVMRSVAKLFDLELALMLRHYQLDSEDRIVARERQVVAERIAALRTLTTGLAHEVRNPLNSATLQLELLERRFRRTGDDDKLIEPLRLAQHELDRLTNLMSEFLAFAQPKEVHRDDHDVVAIVMQALEVERAEDRTGTEIVLAPASPITASIDGGKLHQIVRNLVRNAVEAAPGGHVEVAVLRDDHALHVRVSDDGPGIPDAVRVRMYEPFYSTKDSGTGMGMSIVHNFVTMHGGAIDLRTGPHGTTVDVSLPV